MTPDNACWTCPESATTWRTPFNPAWGIDLVSGLNRTEAQFLESLPTTKAELAELLPACEEHKAVRLVDGQPAPAAPRAGRVRKLNWTQQRKADYETTRAALIELLGGACKDCGLVEDRMGLVVPPGFWRTLGISGRLDRIRYLYEHPNQVRLVCTDHIPVTAATSPTTLSHRDQVETAYGGCCSAPGCGSTLELCVVAGPGATTPRWPGGAKYTSREKLAWLVRNGFPPGWKLACRRHLKG